MKNGKVRFALNIDVRKDSSPNAIITEIAYKSTEFEQQHHSSMKKGVLKECSCFLLLWNMSTFLKHLSLYSNSKCYTGSI